MGKFEIKRNKKGKYEFVLKAPNGQVICFSHEYESLHSCENAIASVKKNSYNSEVIIL